MARVRYLSLSARACSFAITVGVIVVGTGRGVRLRGLLDSHDHSPEMRRSPWGTVFPFRRGIADSCLYIGVRGVGELAGPGGRRRGGYADGYGGWSTPTRETHVR